MADRHERDKTAFRPPPEVKAEAQDALAAHGGWTMNDVLIACLTWLGREPAAFLAALEQYRPPVKRGRPRKQPES